MAKKKKEEIKDETIREIVEEDVKEVDEKVDEPEEDVKETPKKETPPKEPEVTPEEIAKEAEAKAETKVKQDVLKALGVTKDEKKEAEDKGWKTPWDKRGEKNPADWKEALDASADLAEFRRVKAEELRAEEAKVVAERKKEQLSNLNKFWDTQLTELRTLGKIPKIGKEVQAKIKKNEQLTPEELKDPGLVTQKELVETMYSVGEEREKQGKPIIHNLKEIYYEHYESKDNQPPGADAPVSGGTSAVATGKDEPLDYEKDVRGRSYEEILQDG